MPYTAASGCDPIDLAQHNRPSDCPSPYGNLVDPHRKTTNATVRCSVSDQDEQNVERIRGFFNWAKDDPMVAGFNPWHFYNWYVFLSLRAHMVTRNNSARVCSCRLVFRSGPAMSGCNEMRLGAIAQPKLMQELRKVGKYIKDRAKTA